MTDWVITIFREVILPIVAGFVGWRCGVATARREAARRPRIDAGGRWLDGKD